MACKPRLQHKLLSSVTLLTGGSLAFVGINVYNGNADFYQNLLMPTVHRLFDPETAHSMAIKFAKYKCVPKVKDSTLSPELARVLETEMWGKKFTNPLGLAAGFDKDGEALPGLTEMGFGFIEVGSVTPLPQPGNEKPRVFRLIEDKGIINRYGFNSSGHEVVKKNLEKFWLGGEKKPLANSVHIGVNLGKNKSSSENSDEDYLKGLRLFSQDERITYFVINISSPNTPGLRRMQNREQFIRLLDSIATLKASGEIKHPVLIKISPDLSYEERADIAKAILKKNNQHVPLKIVDGIVVSNTTTSRPDYLKDKGTLSQQGGLSGAPIKSLSTQAIHDMYKLTSGQVPIIGVGGVFSGEDAFEKIRAGASLIQLYTSFTLEGPPIIASIKRQLASILREKNFNSIVEAVGADHRE